MLTRERATTLPDTIDSVEQLEDLLSTPTQALIDDGTAIDGDVLILGAGGKVGPTLAMMAKRAWPGKRVVAVARFSDADVRRRLAIAGVETIACDLLDREQVARLPDCRNIVYMAGRKFGTAGSEPGTWAMNAVAPAIVGERFHESRMIAFSTLCVYPFARIAGPGSGEDDPTTPLGEYANSCVARERVLQYYSTRNRCPGRLIRLNYAIDLRYGVLHDVAKRVRSGSAIDLSTAVANVIWQGDANAWILRSFRHVALPATPLNLGMSEPARIRAVAEAFGREFAIAPVFTGSELPTAWHNDTSQAARLFGRPTVDLATMIRWNAAWLRQDLPVYDKPTRYEQREGRF